MKPRLFITRQMPERVLAAAQERFDVDMREFNTPLAPEEMVDSLRRFDVVLPTLRDLYSAEIFAQVPEPRCRMLASFGAGYNHIDVEAARQAGIIVSNTPGAVTDATADIGVMLMLMSSRRASEGERLVRAGKWGGWYPMELLGLHMSGKTLGIVGMGRVGKAVARRAHHGFGMRVMFYNRSRVEDPGVPSEQLETLGDLMSAVDIVVVTVPGSPATRHLIDAEALAAMRPHAHLVNISRGDVVDEAALIAALEDRRIGGAGLDVYENEPEVPERLRALDNVTLLPHLGTATHEVRESMGMMALENAVTFIEGRDPPNRV